MPLARKIILYALLLIVIVATGTGLIFYKNAEQASKESQLSHMKYINKIKRELFTKRLEALRGNTITLRETPPVKSIARALLTKNRIDPITKEHFNIWKKRLTQIFRDFLRANPQYYQIRMISHHLGGQEIIRIERVGSQIVDDLPLQNKSQREYYKKGLQLQPGEIYLSPIRLNQESGSIQPPHKPIIRSVTPFYVNNKVQGLIVINKNAQYFLNEYAQSFAKHTTSIIYDDRQNFLAHPNSELLFLADRRKDNPRKIASPMYWESSMHLAHKESTIEHLDVENSKLLSHLTVYKYNPSDPKRFLVFVTQTQIAPIFSTLNKVMYRTGSVVLLSILLLLPLGILLAHQFTRPLTTFIDIIRKFRISGKYSPAERPLSNFSEINELISSFNELTETIELQQKKMLSQEKFAALGVLSSGIAHEINNPLAVIKSYIDSLEILIQQERFEKKLLQNLATRINQATLRIRDIVEGLTTFSMGGHESNLRKVNLKDIVNTSIKFVQAKTTHGVELRYQTPAPPIFVRGNPGPLSQVVANLLLNACYSAKQSKDSWVEIRLEIDNGFAFLKVMDSGKLPNDIIDKIMDPFFTTKPEGQGTGLGLSISMNIVEKYNGQLYVDRQCSHTCFVVKIPQV